MNFKLTLCLHAYRCGGVVQEPVVVFIVNVWLEPVNIQYRAFLVREAGLRMSVRSYRSTYVQMRIHSVIYGHFTVTVDSRSIKIKPRPISHLIKSLEYKLLGRFFKLCYRCHLNIMYIYMLQLRDFMIVRIRLKLKRLFYISCFKKIVFHK